MSKLTVIIPFFQRESGILTRALQAIMRQSIPDGWWVDVIVVDDGSPVAASGEVQGLQVLERVRLRVIRKENGGVGMARNRGLDEVDATTSLIAFLDSDDLWPTDHIARAIRAMDDGFDFYFTDNRREGHHESHCRSPYVARTRAFLGDSPQKKGLLEIPVDCMIGLTLGEFPCQASTVVYRRRINSGLRFNDTLKYSGEDVVFMTTLVASAGRVCFDLDSVVECGRGVNIYFANLSWDSESFLAIKVDELLTHKVIDGNVKLAPDNKQWNDQIILRFRRELAFHMLRSLLREPTRAFREIIRLSHMAPRAACGLPMDMVRVALDRVLSGDEVKQTA